MTDTVPAAKDQARMAEGKPALAKMNSISTAMDGVVNTVQPITVGPRRSRRCWPRLAPVFDSRCVRLKSFARRLSEAGCPQSRAASPLCNSCR